MAKVNFDISMSLDGFVTAPLVPLHHVEEAVQKREEETGFVIHMAGLNQHTET